MEKNKITDERLDELIRTALKETEAYLEVPEGLKEKIDKKIENTNIKNNG